MAVSIGDYIRYYRTQADVNNDTPVWAVVLAVTGDPPTAVTVRVLEPTQDDDYVVGSDVPAGVPTPQPTPVSLSAEPTAGQGVPQVPVQTASTPAVFNAKIAAGEYTTDARSSLYVVGNDSDLSGVVHAVDITSGAIRPTTDHLRIVLTGQLFSGTFNAGEERILGSATFGPSVAPSAIGGDFTYNAGVFSWTTWDGIIDATLAMSVQTNAISLWSARLERNPAWPVVDRSLDFHRYRISPGDIRQLSGSVDDAVGLQDYDHFVIVKNEDVAARTLIVESVHLDFTVLLG